MRRFIVFFGVATVRAMRVEKVQQRAGEQNEIRREPQSMAPMLAQNEKCSDDGERRRNEQPFVSLHILMLLSLNALAMTLTELAAIAAAAMIGDKSRPKIG